MYRVTNTSRAEKELKRLDRQVKNRIIPAIAALADGPRAPGAVRVRSEEGVWRIRVGDWYNDAMSKKSDDRIVASPELAAIAEAQGVKPQDLDQILSEEPIVPDDETADMMIEAIYGWRDE